MGDVVRMVALPDSVVQLLERSSQREGISLSELVQRMTFERELMSGPTHTAVDIRLRLDPQGYQDIRDAADTLRKPLREAVCKLLNLGIWVCKVLKEGKHVWVEDEGTFFKAEFTD